MQELQDQHDQDCAEREDLMPQVDSKKEKLTEKITSTLIENGRVLRLLAEVESRSVKQRLS